MRSRTRDVLLIAFWGLLAIGAGDCGNGAPLSPLIEDAGVTGSDAQGGSGQAGHGGQSGSGGAPASGGASGSVGATGSGGAPGSGGATGSGGAGGASCAPVPAPEGGKVCTDVLINSAASVVDAMDCVEVTGSIAVSGTFVGTVELPRLRKVGQDVRRDGAPKPQDPTDPAQVTRLRMPNLTQIGGDLWFYLDFNLIELDLRSVETIGGRAWVYRDTLIDTLRLDALHTVGRDFYIADVFRLPDCVADDIASHLTAGESVETYGAATPANCSCQLVCGHVEQRCP